MTKEEIKAELASLEAELKQMIANANFINGATQAFHKMLALVEAKEQAAWDTIKAGVTKEEPPKT